MNEIVQVKTVPVSGPNGPTHAMMMALNVNDPGAAEGFIADVVEQFKLNRMVAPPDTSLLLITLIGDLPADRFAARWHRLVEGDEVARAFMSLMAVADAVQGTRSGRQLSKASLLPPAQPPPEKPWWKVW